MYQLERDGKTIVDVKDGDRDRWKIQSIITETIEKKIRSRLFDNGTAVDRARLTALAQPYAMLTERVSRPFINRHSKLNDFAAVQRYRMILGINPTNNEEKCICKATLTYNHISACIKTRKLCTEPRHDITRDAVKRALNFFDLHSAIEYRPLAYAANAKKPTRIRPDGKTPSLNKLWDVCVTTPTCDSYVKNHSDVNGLVAAKHHESVKRDKYDKVAESEGLTFSPLVFESFGGFGPAAVDFISSAAEQAVEVSGGGLLERAQIVDYIRCTIAFAIANGNAALIRNALRLSSNRPAEPIVIRPVVRGLPFPGASLNF